MPFKSKYSIFLDVGIRVSILSDKVFSVLDWTGIILREFVDTYIPLRQKVKYKILSYDYFYVF